MTNVENGNNVVRNPTRDPTTLQQSLLSEAVSMGMKKVVHQNSHEANLSGKRQRTLDVIRRYAVTQIDREEKELKQNLTRLHEERQLRTRADATRDDMYFGDTDSLFADSQSIAGDEDDVINPYPITFPTRKISMPSRVPSNASRQTNPEPRFRRGRRVSVEFEDLDVHASTGKLLPPIHLESHPEKSSSRLSSCSSVASGVFLRRALSSVSARSSGSFNTDRREGAGTPWVGDPSAIGSVRRPRKTMAQQKLDAMVRSQSVKETRPSTSGSGASASGRCARRFATCALSRSISMKEGHVRSLPSDNSLAESPHESVIVPAQGFSAHHRRVKSLKEPRAKTRRAKPGNEPLSETLSCLDLHKARDEGQLPRSSARPDSSLTRTMRWLQKYTSPGSLSPRSLQSSVSSLARDGSSSSSSTEAGNATLSPRTPREEDASVSMETSDVTPLDYEATASPETAAEKELTSSRSQPIRIQHVSRDTSQSSLRMRQRLAIRRGKHSLGSPPLAGTALPPLPPSLHPAPSNSGWDHSPGRSPSPLAASPCAPAQNKDSDEI